MLSLVFDRLGAQIARRPRTTIAVWLVVTLVCFAFTLGGLGGQRLFDRLTTGAPGVPGSDSATAQAILTDQSTTGPSLTLAVNGVDPADPRWPPS